MTFSGFDVLCLVCGVCMYLKMPKKAYRYLGAALVIVTLWSALVVPLFNETRSRAKALYSTVSTPVEYSQDQIQQWLISEADSQGVDPALVLTFSECESRHRNVIGDGGRSFGPLQVNTDWHAMVNPTDPHESIAKGVSILRDRLERYHGDIVKARLAYVCGTPEGCSQGKRDHVVSTLVQAADMYGLSL